MKKNTEHSGVSHPLRERQNTGVTLRQVPLADIVLSGDNQRKFGKKPDADDIELAESVKGGGVRQPVQVRPHPKKKGKYELRAGERRYRAALAAGVETIGALVYTGISDAEAMDLTYIENKFRKDLAPMEEAAEVALLIERFGGDVKAIAAKIGHKERWIRLRANINANLIRPWKNIFENIDKHESFASWSIKHLTLIARLPGSRQKDLLDDMTDYYFRPENYSSNDLKEFIAKELKLLSKSKWNLDDETLLPKAGACSKCVKRSGQQPMLWFDGDDQVEAGDKCLDGHCWQAKEMAWLARQAKDLKDKHPKLVYIVKGYPSGEQSRNIAENVGEYLNDCKYKTVSKSAKGAVPAMYVFGKSAGKLTYIKPDKARAGQTGRAKGTPTPLKERRAMLKAKRWAQVLIDLKKKVKETEVAGIQCSDRVTAVMAMVAFEGNCSIGHEIEGDLDAEINKLLADKKNGKFMALEYLWKSFKPTLRNSLTYCGPITQTPEHCIKKAGWIAGIIGADIKKMFKEVSKQKGFGEPKSWASLNEDGTPKKGKSEKCKVTKVKNEKVKKV